ncbi:MAG: hypothetical protein ACRDQF_19845, partial [Thermocrispum sp.]
MTEPIVLEVVPSRQVSEDLRVPRDRLEVLTALVGGPRFDPLFRGQVLVFPPDHPTYRWRCLVSGCERFRGYSYAPDLCQTHATQWSQAKVAGTTYPDFLLSAQPVRVRGTIGQVTCRICRTRPATTRNSELCFRHRLRWSHARNLDSSLVLDEWCADEFAYDGFGECLATGCSDLAASPLGLCRWHELTYEGEGRPGGARLPTSWIRWGEAVGRPVVVRYDDHAEFLRWCVLAPSETTHGRLDLQGLRPLVTEELRWALFRHTEGDRSRWTLPRAQSLINLCRRQQADSLVDLDVTTCTLAIRMMVKEMLDELRLVYFAPADTRDAGFLETE